MKIFRDLGRSEHYFQGAREQGPPLGGLTHVRKQIIVLSATANINESLLYVRVSSILVTSYCL